MDYQTPQVRMRSADGKAEPLTELVGAIGQHITSLVELQIQLAAQDLKTVAMRMAPPLAMCIFAICLSLGACMAFCIAIAELIVRYAHLERGFSYLLVAVLAIIAAGTLVAIAIPRAKKSVAALERSKNEFFTNLRSLSSVWTSDIRQQTARTTTPPQHNGTH